MKIEKIASTHELVDIMDGAERWRVEVDGQYGTVELMDVMPRLVPQGRTADFAIVQAARTSTGLGLKELKDDNNLLRYLFRHAHTTPFEMVNLKFRMVLPIFVARQLIRHRTASVNEYSLRYADAKDRFWFPDPSGLRAQSTINKQHTEGSVDLIAAETFIGKLKSTCADAMGIYREALANGIGRELSRVVLPTSLYTEWVWEIDLKNLFHFLGLRQDKHAQKEIRDYADAVYELIKPLVPIAIEAYDQYHPNRNGLLLTEIDIKLARGELQPADVENDRELQEANAKLSKVIGVTDTILSIRNEITRRIKEKK